MNQAFKFRWLKACEHSRASCANSLGGAGTGPHDRFLPIDGLGLRVPRTLQVSETLLGPYRILR